MLNWFRYSLIGLLSLTGSVVSAKDPPPAPPPPMVQAENVSLYRGETVEIPLRAIGRAPGQLRFLIRSQPTQGTLGPIRLIDRKNAVVTYTHTDSTGTGMDKFSFAVQAADSAVSAPAWISIAISEPPPELTISRATLEFGSVLLGETAEQEVTIKNSGGGNLSGQFEVPAPWTILGSSAYSLGRGEARTIRLRFTPTEERAFSGRLTFSHDRRAAILLEGQGLEAISISPRGRWELSSAAGSTERSLQVTLKNQTPQDRSVEIKLPPQCLPLAPIELTGGQEKTVTLQTVSGLVKSLDDRAMIREGTFVVMMPITAFPLPAMLRIDPDTALDFGEVPPGRRAKRILRITNAGGINTRLTAEIPNEILLVPDPGTVLLAPGETRSFDVFFESSKPGQSNSKLTLRANEGLAKELPVTARSTEKTLLVPAAKAMERIKPFGSKEDRVPLEPTNSIPAIESIDLKQMTTSEIEIIWKKPAANALRYVIEQRQLDLTGEALQVRWAEWRDVKFDTDDQGQVTALFEGLSPSGSWFIRVMSIDELGTRSAASPTFRIATAPVKSMSGWIWVLLFLGLAGAGWSIWRRTQVIVYDEDQGRIDRLGKP